MPNNLHLSLFLCFFFFLPFASIRHSRHFFMLLFDSISFSQLLQNYPRHLFFDSLVVSCHFVPIYGSIGVDFVAIFMSFTTPGFLFSFHSLTSHVFLPPLSKDVLINPFSLHYLNESFLYLFHSIQHNQLIQLSE